MQKQAVAPVSALDNQLKTAQIKFINNPTDALSEIKTLIDKGANVNARFEGGNTPLMMAVRLDDAQELIKLLLSRGADDSLRNNLGLTASAIAKSGSLGRGKAEEYVKIIDDFVKSQPIKARPSKPAAPSSAPVAEVKAIPAKPVVPSAAPALPATAFDAQLKTAIIKFINNPTDALSEIKTLIDKGANVNARFEGGNTPLMMAVRLDDAQELIKLLLSRGADHSLVNNLGLTASGIAKSGSLGRGKAEEYVKIIEKK